MVQNVSVKNIIIFVLFLLICFIHMIFLFNTNTTTTDGNINLLNTNDADTIFNLDLIRLNASLTSLRNELQQKMLLSSRNDKKDDTNTNTGLKNEIENTLLSPSNHIDPSELNQFPILEISSSLRREKRERNKEEWDNAIEIDKERKQLKRPTIPTIPVVTTSTGRPSAINASPNSNSKFNSKVITGNRTKTGVRVVIFTMDSFPAYEEASKKGGAAGELLIRYSLQYAFDKLGVTTTVIRSDAEFNQLNAQHYDYILIDPWTWAGPGWIAKPVLRGRDTLAKIYVLDFFGYQRLKGTSLPLPDDRYLTAFGGSSKNTFLGYFLPPLNSSIGNTAAPAPAPAQAQALVKKQQGVIWGKDPKHFNGIMRRKMLSAIADRVPLIATTKKIFEHPNIFWIGHQTSSQWHHLLLESRFMIGMGDPLLGPSAIDAISNGCVYINPIYKNPVREHFTSQHPYAREKIGNPRVCSTYLDVIPSVMSCVEDALTSDLKPYTVPDFTEDAYLVRVKKIFHLN